MAFDGTVAGQTLRDYQHDAICKLRQSLAEGKRRPVLMAPTGAGKTVVAAEILALAREKSRRVAFCVPALSLIDQTVERFWQHGVRDIGVIQADHVMTDWSKPVQVCSIQTLERRGFPQADLVIVDECHRASKLIEKWVRHPDWQKVPFIGLSATPWAKGMGKLYDDLIIVATTAQLIDKGFLSKFRVFAPSHPDLSGVKIVAGDYHEKQLSERMSKPQLVADVVETWIKRGEGRPTLCFAVDRAHAKHLQECFEAAGIPCGYQDAFTKAEERESIRRQFHDRRLKVVCNVGTLTTGVDWDVRCLIMARPTRSEMLFVQIIGRGLRAAQGKEDCIARDALILTDRGEVKIQDVTLDDKVWDGVQFVSHGGAVCRGKQRVISHDGLTATPDHKVMTNEGWVALADAHRRGLRIARTGIDGRPLRFVDDRVKDGARIDLQIAGRGAVRSLRRAALGAISQYQEASRYEGMPALQWASVGYGAALALPSMPSAAKPLSKSVGIFVRALRRAWDRVSVREPERGCAMDRGESWNCGSIDGDRSDQQRRTLRAGKPAVGSSSHECEQQHAVGWWSRAFHFVSAALSRSALRRPNSDAAYCDEIYGRADSRTLEETLGEAQREVWDILGAGPLQRFTANGRLVHNCLILDHSDNHLRLGFVTDIHHDALDDGKPKGPQQKRQAPLPKECPKCSYLKPAKVRTCPACGFTPEPTSTVEQADGELEEMRSKGKKDAPAGYVRIGAALISKREFFGELKRYARDKGYKPGWASNQFRDYTGTWPNAYRDAMERPVSYEVQNWIRSRMIRFAKRKAKDAPTIQAS